VFIRALGSFRLGHLKERLNLELVVKNSSFLKDFKEGFSGEQVRLDKRFLEGLKVRFKSKIL